MGDSNYPPFPTAGSKLGAHVIVMNEDTITEFGIDPMVNPKPHDAPDAAWKDLGGYWNKHKDDAKLDYERQKYPVPLGVDFSGPKESKYLEQFKWYDQQMQQDPYVIGATIFTFGSFGGAWERFDVTAHAGLKVRASRSVDAPFLEALPAGAQVTVLEGPVPEGSQVWLRIRAASGTEGWVRPSGENNQVYLAPLG